MYARDASVGESAGTEVQTAAEHMMEWGSVSDVRERDEIVKISFTLPTANVAGAMILSSGMWFLQTDLSMKL